MTINFSDAAKKWEDALQKYLSPNLIRFVKFGIIGSLGFLWDSVTVYGLRPFVGLTLATLIAYFVAASFNWLLNRLWTFKGAAPHLHPVLQWLRFLLASSSGFFLNRGTVYILFFLFPLCVRQPIFALMAGALAGMLANFNLSQKLVFKALPPTSVQDLITQSVRPQCEASSAPTTPPSGKD